MLCTYLKRLGFEERIVVSHRVFVAAVARELRTLQAATGGLAKAYKVRQIRQLPRGADR
jgi:hypothetical protein